MLEAVAKGVARPGLGPKTRRYFDAFHTCRACPQLCWRGAHDARLGVAI
ncbi:MAG: hypothetical protein H6666_07485 [Ardenticatenaceae bacterium]|nr:hypothetical protein [Ardenticatenaceae bacterium]